MTKALGAFGEAWAAGYLTRQGYRIVDRNVRFRVGEIDLIAWDGDELVFIEVKCRRTARYGAPAESITPARFARLTRAVESYLQCLANPPESYRVDLVAVVVGHSGAVEHAELLRGLEAPRA